MQRRAFLGAVGISVLAGCSDGNNSSTEPSPTTTATSQSGTGSPNFEFLDVQIPESVELNDPTSFTIYVENTGSGEGTFTSKLETKTGDTEWSSTGEIDMTLSAGERGAWKSPSFTLQYLNPVHFRLAAFDQAWTVEASPKTLTFGSHYDVPTGLRLNALGGSFESEYPTESNETATTPPEDNQTWLVVRLDVRNRLQESIPAPSASEFVLEINGESQPQYQEISDDPYEGGSLSGRTVRRGDLVYAVPEETKAVDLTLLWEQSLPVGDVKAIWSK